MSNLNSIEEYQMPLADIARLLAKRGAKVGTAFYRVKFEPGHGFGVTIALLITEQSAQITLLINQRIRDIDFRIAEFTGASVNFFLGIVWTNEISILRPHRRQQDGFLHF